MRGLNLGLVSALNLRERVILAAGGLTLVAAALLSAIGDLNWLLPFAIACWYAMVIVGTWNRAERRRSNALGNEIDSGRQPIPIALSVAYWSFFMILVGLVMAWVAVFQLTSRGGSAFSFVLLAAGVVSVGGGGFLLANMLRRSSK
jgi:hypothetical protein